MTAQSRFLSRWATSLAIVTSLFSPAAALCQEGVEKDARTTIAWPEVTQSARPWTRWWWHGSAVDEANLTRLLEEYRSVGLGGVEITSIYGVKGNEHRNREYLSEEWIQAVQHTLGEAQRLEMGVDLPAGSGWRMGGPGVTPELANHRVEIEKQQVSKGTTFVKRFERSTPQVAMAYSNEGQQVELSDRIVDGKLEWTAPEGNWTVYTLAYRWAGDRVKRPGPGGAGRSVNPFWEHSVSTYLGNFGKALEQLEGVRAQFHDSFEYEGNWQPVFLEEFAERRGYRLEQHLPALMGDGPEDIVRRVKCDYRVTLADLVLDDLVKTWVDWAHSHGQLVRNQSHGSPGNWLDLYAACDIPETESFGRLHGDDADKLLLKFASSAANVAGRKLVSSESATWLDEHFNVTLAQVKQMVDRQILAGVNHVFYHGTAYSPDDAKWPGWLFYASTQLNPQNPIWRDFGTLNSYVTRCQSVLQRSQPDNDILLYWPLHDAWHWQSGLRMDIRVHNGGEWFDGRPIGHAAELLTEHGYAFDYVSDRGLESCQPGDGGLINAPGGRYAAVVVPKAQHVPLKTLYKLTEFAEAGAAIIYWGELPKSAPGMAGSEATPEWKDAIARARRSLQSGRVEETVNLFTSLNETGIRAEQGLTSAGIHFLRKRRVGDTLYFLRNDSSEAVDGWITLRTVGRAVAIMDPLSGKIGRATVRSPATDARQVRLQLAAGQTLFVRVCESEIDSPDWPYREPAGDAVAVDGPWQVDFLEGGPSIPESFETAKPRPWTDAPDKAAEAFAGTVRYSTTLGVPKSGEGRWLLDLGEVLGSARVRVGGKEMATLVAPPYVVELDELQEEGNQLVVEVTGVAANRIRDLDRRGVEWRIFEDINLVDIDYRPFDASNWRVRPLGLVGPVRLIPLSDAGDSRGQ